MNSDQLRTSAAVWQSRQTQIIHETERFTVPLADLTDDELLGLFWIIEEDILFSIWAMENIVHPRQRPALKSAICYMTELHERQQAAFSRLADETDDLLFRIKRKIESHATRPV